MTDEVDTLMVSKPSVPIPMFSEPLLVFVSNIFKDTDDLYLVVHACRVRDTQIHEGAFVRVDSNKAFTVSGPNYYPLEPLMLEQMKKGETLRVEAHCFYEESKIVSVSLKGFMEAYDKYIKILSLD